MKLLLETFLPVHHCWCFKNKTFRNAFFVAKLCLFPMDYFATMMYSWLEEIRAKSGLLMIILQNLRRTIRIFLKAKTSFGFVSVLCFLWGSFASLNSICLAPSPCPYTILTNLMCFFSPIWRRSRIDFFVTLKKGFFLKKQTNFFGKSHVFFSLERLLPVLIDGCYFLSVVCFVVLKMGDPFKKPTNFHESFMLNVSQPEFHEGL